jgi:hypothetical protein
MQLQLMARTSVTIRVDFFDQSGRLISSQKFLQPARTVITLDDLADKTRGTYIALIYIDDKIFR